MWLQGRTQKPGDVTVYARLGPMATGFFEMAGRPATFSTTNLMIQSRHCRLGEIRHCKLSTISPSSYILRMEE